jgi:arginyl-tRNA synthetase
LNFEANSAPFINYAYTRGLGILKKLGKLDRPSSFDRLIEPVEQNLILALAQFPEKFARSAEELNPTALCLYTNELAQRFHEFYEKSDISHLADDDLKQQRAALVEASGIVLQSASRLMGLELAERM